MGGPVPGSQFKTEREIAAERIEKDTVAFAEFTAE